MTTEAVLQEQTAGWIPTDATFGARLALVRQKLGWNVKEAAQKCGLPAENWRRWERDGIEPKRLVTISMTIAPVVGCDFLWLVHGPNRGQIRTSAYGSTRVLATSSTTPKHPSSFGHLLPTRAVRQTRPLVGVSLTQRSPISV
jgi:transcriptional regulator with XRE-family HTH domain